MRRTRAKEPVESDPTDPSSAGMRVLIVVDQPLLAELVALTLNHGRFEIRQVASAGSAVAALRTWPVHLVILDMDLEGVNGARVLALDGVRGLGTPTPVVALSRRGDLRSKLRAFDLGADDILTVPFSPEELLARVVAVLRRSYNREVRFSRIIRLGEIEIDILARTVRAGTSELHLTPLEQSLLYLLASNAGRVIRREEILDTLWGPDYVADSNVVDRQVRNLRVRLQNDWRKPRFIATVPGQGYRFIPTFSESQGADA